MVRTKADAGSTKVCAAKAPRKVLSSGGSNSSGASPSRSGSSKDKYAGGNSYNPQPIPNWQKGISTFFKPHVPRTNGESSSSEPCSTSSSSSDSNGNESTNAPQEDLSDEGSSSTS